MIPQFPEKFFKYQPIIERLYNDDETFREICTDYQTYRDALKFWKQSDAEDAPAFQSEYTELVGEIEDELTDILSKSASLNKCKGKLDCTKSKNL